MTRALAILALLFAVAAPAEATRLHTSGLETNNLTSTEWNATNGSPSITTTNPRSGTYALSITTSASQVWVRRSWGFNTTSGSLFYGFGFKFASLPAAATTISRMQNSILTEELRVELNTDGTVTLRNMVPGTPTTCTSSATLSGGATAWNYIEVRILLSDTVGEMELRINETSECSLTGQDTLLGTANVATVSVGSGGVNTTIESYYDDVKVNDSNGSLQTSWPGDDKLAMVVPTAEGATINYTPLSGTDNALMVDDVPGAPDDATTYNSSTTAAHVDRLVLGDLPAEVPSDAVLSLAWVFGRVGGTGTTGSPTMQFKFWDEGGSLTNGPTCDKVDINGWNLVDGDEGLAVDLAGKSKTDAASFEAGYGIVTDTSVTQRVTALWVYVEWDEAPAAPDCVPTLTMLGVGRCG